MGSQQKESGVVKIEDASPSAIRFISTGSLNIILSVRSQTKVAWRKSAQTEGRIYEWVKKKEIV